MPQPRTLTLDRRSRGARTERKTFKLPDNDYVYTTRRLNIARFRNILEDVAELENLATQLESSDDQLTGDQLAQVGKALDLLDQFMAAMLTKESFEHLKGRLEDDDDDLDTEDLIKVFPQIMGLISGRPTGPASDSARSRSATG